MQFTDRKSIIARELCFYTFPSSHHAETEEVSKVTFWREDQCTGYRYVFDGPSQTIVYFGSLSVRC